MSEAPNDILIRITKTADGGYSRETLLAVNDDALVPEMERTAKFLAKCLELFDKSDSEIEYHEALNNTPDLAKLQGRIKLLNS